MKKINFLDTEVAFSYKDDNSLKRSYKLFRMMNNKRLVRQGSKLLKFALKVGLPVKGYLKRAIYKQFCGGENLTECSKPIDLLYHQGVYSVLDFANEGVYKRDELDNTEKEILQSIRFASENHALPFSVFKCSGIMFFSMLEKIQSGENLNEKEQGQLERAKIRFDNLIQEAYSLNQKIFIDAEESWIQDVVDEMVIDEAKTRNKSSTIVFNTYQMYRTDSLDRLKNDLEAVKNAGSKLGVKLVRGAYLEKENERAKDLGITSPINSNKAQTDELYDAALGYCLENLDNVEICIATHNEASCRLAIEVMEQRGISVSDKRIFFCQLYGMGDHISYNLRQAGYNVAKYLPYGPVKSTIPYLMRRAEENSSVKNQTSRELKLYEWEMKRRGLL